MEFDRGSALRGRQRVGRIRQRFDLEAHSEDLRRSATARGPRESAAFGAVPRLGRELGRRARAKFGATALPENVGSWQSGSDREPRAALFYKTLRAQVWSRAIGFHDPGSDRACQPRARPGSLALLASASLLAACDDEPDNIEEALEESGKRSERWAMRSRTQATKSKTNSTTEGEPCWEQS